MWVAADAGAGQFALPLMLASIHQLPAASLGDGSTATITLIARRAAQRAGTRHWRRGADPEVPTPRSSQLPCLLNMASQGEVFRQSRLAGAASCLLPRSTRR